MKIRIINYGILLSLLLFFILIIKISIVGYQDSDDYVFSCITSGAYSGNPSPMTVFEGYFFSHLVAGLYSFLPWNVEWYALIFHFFYLFSYAVIIWKLLESNLCWSIKWVVILASAPLEIYLLISPQFTILPAVLTLASYVLLLSNSPKIFDFVLAAFLIFTATQIRTSSVELIILLLAPLFFLPIKLKEKMYYVKVLFLLSVVLGSIQIGKMTRTSYYVNDDWKSFMEYNKFRGSLQDNVYKYRALSIFSDDVKRDEYMMLCKAGLVDGQLLSLQDLKSCKEFIQQYKVDIFFKNLKPYLKGYFLQGILILVFWMLYLLIESVVKRKRWDTFILLLTAMAFVAANLYCMNSSRVKERIIIDMMLALYIVAAYETYRLLNGREILVVACVVGFFTFSVNIWKCWSWEIIMSKRLQESEEVNMILSKVESPKLHYISTKVPQIADIYDASETPCITKYIGKGWLSNFPLHKTYYNHYPSMVNGVPVLMKKGDIKNLEIVEYALKKYYNIETKRKRLASSDHYDIIQLVSLED